MARFSPGVTACRYWRPLILGVPDTVFDTIMGWEPDKSARRRPRYQHLTDRVLTDTADKIGGLLWPLPEEPPAA
ncbi:hypothetical protein [Streptomyces tsukubensis]|uniref:hypothetical protein n=1 Tax=Streptomyces tsukubensis TaxID=83656 RepID=UPI001D056866|nr:hypothetical protein [Streptomyces tsukubensis]